MKPDRLLFLDTYTDPTFQSVSSAEIGYGISCASALKSGLRSLGVPVVECSPQVSPKESKLSWIYRSYSNLDASSPQPSDLVLLFNSLIHFPGEVRRLINHHTRAGCPVIGYTHGSHWDPTDSVRAASNPGLLYQDLANLLSYDRLLLVSDYYKDLLRRELAVLGPLVTDRFETVARVVGLPIDTDAIDHAAEARQAHRDSTPTRILFNHALRPPKQPALALTVIERLLTASDNCTVDFSRSFLACSPLRKEFDRLSSQFPGRLRSHGTLSLENYYRLLWQSDIQFSTASHESFGVATVEAMYTGNACFTPNALSYPEITGGIGMYRDTDELVALIAKAIADADFRRQISTSQRALTAKYRPAVIATRLEHVISELGF